MKTLRSVFFRHAESSRRSVFREILTRIHHGRIATSFGGAGAAGAPAGSTAGTGGVMSTHLAELNYWTKLR